MVKRSRRGTLPQVARAPSSVTPRAWQYVIIHTKQQCKRSFLLLLEVFQGLACDRPYGIVPIVRQLLQHWHQ